MTNPQDPWAAPPAPDVISSPARGGKRRTIAWVAAAALGTVVAGGAVASQVGLATAQNATPTPSPSASESAPAEENTDQDSLRGQLRERFEGARGELLHGEVTIETEDGTIVVRHHQNGAVTNVSADSISVESTDGFTQTYVIDADTIVIVDGEEATIEDIAEGDTVRVHGLEDGDSIVASLIAEGEGFGFGRGFGGGFGGLGHHGGGGPGHHFDRDTTTEDGTAEDGTTPTPEPSTTGSSLQS